MSDEASSPRDLSVVLPITMEIWPNSVVACTRLPGGHTNENFIIRRGDDVGVLRIPGDNTALLNIDRNVELEATSLTAKVGIGPTVLQHSSEGAWMLLEYIEGVEPSTDDLADSSTEVAQTLRTVHTCGTVNGAMDPLAIIESYVSTIQSHSVELPIDIALARRRMTSIDKVRPFTPTALCHNDLRHSNFINDGRLRIIDWEYAGMGDPLFDLANFSSNNQLSTQQDLDLLNSYFGTVEPRIVASLHLMKIVSELREITWNLVQKIASSLDLDFDEFAQQRVQRYESLVTDYDFDGLLDEAAKA